MRFVFKKFIKFFISSCVFFPVLTYGLSLPNPVSISAQIGVSQQHVGNRTLSVTPTETDRLIETDNPLVPEFSLGLNYQFPLWNRATHGLIWFPCLLTGINLRYFKQEVTGNVYQYQERLMNNYTYALTIDSVRIMLDILLPLLTFHEKTTIYFLGGIGDAWNQVSYSDTPNLSVPGGALNLNERTTTGFTYELGAGILYPIDKLMAVFLEYRYAHFPTLKTGSKGTLNGMSTRIPPVTFPFDSQTLSFGINWNF